ncbi:gfo/Idh/MocA family oxidoreductase [Aeoliella sp. ICT_H6.2]|uniref:Gfo/Idh/MocA family oxidoreductase n=1 Tax=Aeoliella straminimaris TaxID=2954799 RepID=A0A9X2F8R8_9BACT|nr:Gfo/Idh/MocA family oxidoreductase [Aeoliella straminimaris]MCO6044435.1 gfo/Idh/MocA family oxidoreductase [Aeoliella straminimaris]
MFNRTILSVISGLIVSLLLASASLAKPIRVGIVGCDTSHAVAFAKLINSSSATGALADITVVAAYPGGSDDIASSRDRVAGFTKQLGDMGIEIVEHIADLDSQCDAYLLHSVDGRVHLEQFRKIAQGKPVFIDKPCAASLADAVAIHKIAQQTGTPCFSSSALRFSAQMQQLQADDSLGTLQGATTTSPYKTDPTHPALFWYGIHGVESLYALLGTGCQRVVCLETDNECVAMGTWENGRCGVFRGLKHGPGGSKPYSATVYGSQNIRTLVGFDGYAPLVEEIGEFFVSRKPPVSMEETLELLAFMEAAEQSMQQGGQPVDVQQLLENAVASDAPSTP